MYPNIHNFSELKKLYLPDFAGKIGWEICKKKSCKTWLVLKKDGKNIIIKNQPNKCGTWFFFCPASQKSGTIIDLLRQEGHSYQEINDKIARHFLPYATNTTQPYTPPVLFDAEKSGKKAENLMRKVLTSSPNFLEKKRGITQKIQEIYNVKANNNCAVFPLFINSKLVSSITYQNNGNKFFQKGEGARSAGALSVLRPKTGKETSDIIIFESPIDGLSLAQFLTSRNKKPPYLISTCGSLTIGIITEIKRINDLENFRLFVSFDNDKKGEEMTKKLQQHVPVSVFEEKPTGKDWNELFARV